MPVSKTNPVILVIGDLMVDHYIWGECNRISPEAPVQVVNVKKETTNLGGSLNVINNLVSLGATVYAGGVIGNDALGKLILERLKELNVNAGAIVKEDNRPTTQKSRVLAANHQVIRVDREDTSPVNENSQHSIIDFVKKNIATFDIILLSDYAKGVLTPLICQEIIKVANENNCKVLIDPKGADFSKYQGAHLITPNKKETTLATGIELKDDHAIEKAGKLLKEKIGLDKVVLTLSEKGIALYENELQIFPTAAREVYDVTGAGDTVLAALGYSISTGSTISEACRFANAAAAVVIGKVGSATATHEEIASFLQEPGTTGEALKILSWHELDDIVSNLKRKNEKIVFTNGCFDILHAGHVSYLQKARQLGDVLILGLNSDASTKRLKGPGRPVNSEEDRAFVLAGLSCVDYIAIFEEDTPYELIKHVKPDLLVKGKDYENKEVVGSDIAKEVVLIDFIEGKSTTNILKKIQST